MKRRSQTLRRVANEMLAIARELERLEEFGDEPTFENGNGSSVQDDPVFVEYARQTYFARRERTRIFDETALFGEPAWDILLDLFIASKERRKLSTSAACIGAAVPPTTALRWLAVLEQHKLIEREDDPGDARRHFVVLTPLAYDKMLQYFALISQPTMLKS